MVEIRCAGDALWDRIERAVQNVKDRLARVSKALDAAGIPYAVIGGSPLRFGSPRSMNPPFGIRAMSLSLLSEAGSRMRLQHWSPRDSSTGM